MTCKVFEAPVFSEVFENAIRPGGFAVTAHAMEICQFGKKARLLDVGCGCGATVEFLETNFDISAVGIDSSKVLLKRGKDRNPKLNIVYGDGELLEFPSFSFDGVFMECSLSLFENKTEALHEAYCVLKKGGKLIISDFYLRDANKNVEGDNGQVKTCISGAFVLSELNDLLSELGFRIILWEDKTAELKSFMASMIMHYGSMENFYQSVLKEEKDALHFAEMIKQKKPGYFLLIAEKP
ncbi:MAG: class I SAM-dependent methyltransferase [Eubacteriales bacterium]|nr:class I SAM-dependent methyltransferase [Eubacteriales bacterium]MDD4583310.1 class I SAM-dependent methyltransferase [Eubacteriales bacterium]